MLNPAQPDVFSWGPPLLAVGAGSLLLALAVHGFARWPTIFPPRPGADADAPKLSERISVHLVAYPLWAVVFGAIVWRGVPRNFLDVRLPFERAWGVWEPAEWIYVSVYLVPIAAPWLAATRASLRRYALNLCWLLVFSLPLFLLPIASPPRAFAATSVAGRMLAWETGQPDFATASLPSFHVFWGLLVAQLFAARGRGWAVVGTVWAIAITVACLANGAHALADVAASWLMFAVLASERSPIARRLQPAADRFLSRNAMTNPTIAPSTSPPMP